MVATKKIFFISFFIIFSCFSKRTVNSENKHVSGSQIGRGLFALFFGALNHLDWCAKNNKQPVIYWDKSCLYYQPQGYNGSTNVWEYYFEPVSMLSYTHGDIIHYDVLAPDGSGFDYRCFSEKYMIKFKYQAKRIIDKYIKIKSNIQNKIDDFYDHYLKNKKTIGIHLRGTDKEVDVKNIPLEIIFKAAAKYDCDQYLVATDEMRLLEEAKLKLPKPVIFYPCYRSHDGSPIHMGNNNSDKALRGEEALIETVLLSKCNVLIHTCSNMSAAAIFFNPNITNIFLLPTP